MLTSNRILAGLAAHFKEYETRLKIGQQVDSAMAADSVSMEDVFSIVTDNLKKLLGVNRVAVCLLGDEGLTPFLADQPEGTCPRQDGCAHVSEALLSSTFAVSVNLKLPKRGCPAEDLLPGAGVL